MQPNLYVECCVSCRNIWPNRTRNLEQVTESAEPPASETSLADFFLESGFSFFNTNIG